MRRVGKAICTLVLAVALGVFSPLHSEARGSGSRPYYGGGHHTTSHGGHYQSGSGSSHKGGKYKNTKTDDQYGKHKP